MNDRQWEIVDFRLCAIETAVESMDRKLDELFAMSTFLDGPPADATCGTCRWYIENQSYCSAEPGAPNPGVTDEDGDPCRHWRPKK